MNSKLKKVVSEIDKIDRKQQELEATRQALLKQKQELENLEIVGLIRGANISTADLAAVIASYQRGGAIPAAVQEEFQNVENEM